MGAGRPELQMRQNTPRHHFYLGDFEGQLTRLASYKGATPLPVDTDAAGRP
jgi:hypothetical protein